MSVTENTSEDQLHQSYPWNKIHDEQDPLKRFHSAVCRSHPEASQTYTVWKQHILQGGCDLELCRTGRSAWAQNFKWTWIRRDGYPGKLRSIRALKLPENISVASIEQPAQPLDDHRWAWFCR